MYQGLLRLSAGILKAQVRFKKITLLEAKVDTVTHTGMEYSQFYPQWVCLCPLGDGAGDDF